MRFLLLLCTLFSSVAFAADYKSAQRLAAGDVISADVFNDILDRIEGSLRIPQESDFVGTWKITQSIKSNNGQPGGESACSGCDDEESENPTDHGFGEALDNLYRQRLDEVTFSADGDGTFSFTTKDYCAFSRVHDWGDNACLQRFALVDGHFVSHELTDSDFSQESYFYVNVVSDTTIILSVLYPTATNYNIVRLDRKAAAPEPPSTLKATIEASSVSLSWTAGDEAETSYSIQSKDAADGTFTELNTSNSESFTDTLAAGITRWYRVFAVNANGTSLGSNVVKVTNPRG